ncbi:MAG: hypothetical protein ACRDT6_04140 [Micromonosporaceae bacterium]
MAAAGYTLDDPTDLTELRDRIHIRVAGGEEAAATHPEAKRPLGADLWEVVAMSPGPGDTSDRMRLVGDPEALFEIGRANVRAKSVSRQSLGGEVWVVIGDHAAARLVSLDQEPEAGEESLVLIPYDNVLLYHPVTSTPALMSAIAAMLGHADTIDGMSPSLCRKSLYVYRRGKLSALPASLENRQLSIGDENSDEPLLERMIEFMQSLGAGTFQPHADGDLE